MIRITRVLSVSYFRSNPMNWLPSKGRALAAVIATSAAVGGLIVAIAAEPLEADDAATSAFSGVECGSEILDRSGLYNVAGRRCLLRAYDLRASARLASSSVGMDGSTNHHIYVVDAGVLQLWHREISPIGVRGPWRLSTCGGLTPNEEWDGPGVGPEESVFVHHGCVDGRR